MDSSKIILLIEDDDVDAMTVKRILKTLGITNKLAHKIDGEEGVDYLTDQANEKPALIMLDLTVPRMNGREFIQDMRKNPNTAEIPVIALSTSNTNGDIVNGNVVAYVIKCLSINNFTSELEACFKRLAFCLQA